MKSKTSKASAVLSSIMQGPASLPEAERKNYNLWVSTWIVPQLAELIPQLGEKLEYRMMTTETQRPFIHGYSCKPSQCERCIAKAKV